MRLLIRSCRRSCDSFSVIRSFCNSWRSWRRVWTSWASFSASCRSKTPMASVLRQASRTRGSWIMEGSVSLLTGRSPMCSVGWLRRRRSARRRASSCRYSSPSSGLMTVSGSVDRRSTKLLSGSGSTNVPGIGFACELDMVESSFLTCLGIGEWCQSGDQRARIKLVSSSWCLPAQGFCR